MCQDAGESGLRDRLRHVRRELGRAHAEDHRAFFAEAFDGCGWMRPAVRPAGACSAAPVGSPEDVAAAVERRLRDGDAHRAWVPVHSRIFVRTCRECLWLSRQLRFVAVCDADGDERHVHRVHADRLNESAGVCSGAGVDRPVVDRTKLTGSYAMAFDWAAKDRYRATTRVRLDLHRC